MARDLKFAVCHTNTAIKKSLVFRNLDLDSSLQIVPPKENPYATFELISPDKNEYKILKTRSFSGNYHSIPSEISDREIATSEMSNNKLRPTKLNSLEVSDDSSAKNYCYNSESVCQHHNCIHTNMNNKNTKLLHRNLKNDSVFF